MAKNNVSDSKIKKFLTILLTSLVLLIPNSFTSDIIQNRIDYRNQAVKNIADSWAFFQIIGLPEMKLNDKQVFALNNYETKIDIKTQIRKKGVFKIPVYSAYVVQKGTFDNPYGTISNRKVKTKIDISDSRGFFDEPKFNINNSGFKVGQDVIFETDLTTNSKSIPFEINYRIKGLDGISVLLGGKKNNISISGDWKSPSFDGDFLPTERNVTNKEFSAQWNIPKIALPNDESKISVSLLVLNNNYVLAQKSLKYAFLLLVLIFMGYFIFEITSKTKKRIHPIQYCLLGASILMFYLLLTSISELIPFGFAYLISSLMVTFLIYAYTYFVVTKKNDFKFSLAIAVLIGLLYFFFYVLLKLQDAALLIGSIGLFIILILVMYVTRNVNWYEENQKPINDDF